MRDRRVPVFTKIIPLIAVVYLVSPIDILPDYKFPLFGHLDDVVVVTILLLLFIAAAPAHVVADQTIGKKLRDLQRKQGIDPTAPGADGPNGPNGKGGKTVDAKIRYIDDDDDDESEDK